MMRRLLLAGWVVLMATGCGHWGDDVPPPRPKPLPPPEKVTIQLEAAEPAPPPAQTPRPPAVPPPRKPVPAKSRPVNINPPRDTRPTGLEGELNDVERAYIRDIKDRNARTEQANEDRVFGGFKPGALKSGGQANSPR